jgi:hypothetical protein
LQLSRCRKAFNVFMHGTYHINRLHRFELTTVVP